ncbi:hypothetical protein MP638_005789 [Amoeboaphelidium occidentale]|nr:hypothetical protein MP638_005789 [Amoeboaphelidium occidentale]
MNKRVDHKPEQDKKYLFDATDNADEWKCKLCSKTIKVKEKTGCSNFKTHACKHSAAVESINAAIEAEKDGSKARLKVSTTVDQKHLNIFGWIEWILMCNLAFSFVSNQYTRKYCNLLPICVNTLKKYMTKLLVKVEEIIADELPDKFGVVLDGWTESGTHYMAVFATFTKITGEAVQYLLACSPMGDETSQSADAIIDFLEDTMEVFGKTIDCIKFLVSDNTEVNPSVCRKLKIPFIGCISHRLSLAMNRFMQLELFSDDIRNIHNLMVKLSHANKRAYLRKFGCYLAPVQRNETRWSSTFNMLNRYFDSARDGQLSFEEAVQRIGDSRECFRQRVAQLEFAALIPDHDSEEWNKLKIMHTILSKVDETTRYLQTSNLNLMDAKEAIDLLLENLREIGDVANELIPIIEEFCSDSYSQVAPYADFVRAARKVLIDPLVAVTDDEIQLLVDFEKEFSIDTAVDISPIKDSATQLEIPHKRKKRKILENDLRIRSHKLADGQLSFEEAVQRIGDSRECFRQRVAQLEFAALIPDHDSEEWNKLKIMHTILSKVDETTRYLQTSNLNLMDAKEAIDLLLENLREIGDVANELIPIIEEFCSDSYSQVAPYADFVRAAKKVLNDPLVAVTDDERQLLVDFEKEFSIDTAVDISPIKDSATQLEILHKRKKRKILENDLRIRSHKLAYHGLESICPTSNICERLFSLAGLIWTDIRKSMLPKTMEMLLFLRAFYIQKVMVTVSEHSFSLVV